MLKRVRWRLSFLTLAVLWAGLELSLRAANPLIWASLPHCEPLSKPLLLDRLRAFAQQRRGKKLCVAIGDSVFYGSALREKGLPDWASQTPVAYLKRDLGPKWLVLDLSADGLEPMDMLALLTAAAGLRPDAVVLELNARMLAPDSSQWPGCMTHPWLAQWLPAAGAFPAAPPVQDPEKNTFSKLEAGLVRLSVGARYAELARSLLFEPSEKEVYAEEVKTLMPGDQAVDPELLLEMKIRPYYMGGAPGPGNLQIKAIGALASEVGFLNAKPFIFLTPQNLDLVSDFLDKSSFQRKRRDFADPFRALKLPYRDLAQAMPTERFLDHCHLDPQGNRELAASIHEGLSP